MSLARVRIRFTRDGRPTGHPLTPPLVPRSPQVNDVHLTFEPGKNEKPRVQFTRNGEPAGKPLPAPDGANDVGFEFVESDGSVKMRDMHWTQDGNRIGEYIPQPEGANDAHITPDVTDKSVSATHVQPPAVPGPGAVVGNDGGHGLAVPGRTYEPTRVHIKDCVGAENFAGIGVGVAYGTTKKAADLAARTAAEADASAQWAAFRPQCPRPECRVLKPPAAITVETIVVLELPGTGLFVAIAKAPWEGFVHCVCGEEEHFV
jgi:hypothetical protein